MDQHVAVVILSTGTSHKITQTVYNQICMADVNDLIRLPGGATFKVSAVLDILSISDFERQHPDKVFTDYHQPYSQLPAGPAKGLAGVINSAPDRGLGLMIAALKRSIERYEQQNSQPHEKARHLLGLMEIKRKQNQAKSSSHEDA